MIDYEKNAFGLWVPREKAKELRQFYAVPTLGGSSHQRSQNSSRLRQTGLSLEGKVSPPTPRKTKDRPLAPGEVAKFRGDAAIGQDPLQGLRAPLDAENAGTHTGKRSLKSRGVQKALEAFEDSLGRLDLEAHQQKYRSTKTVEQDLSKG